MKPLTQNPSFHLIMNTVVIRKDKTMLQDIQSWKSCTHLTEDLKAELDAMNEEALNDAFYTNIAFGTAGMRGLLGPGTNRINLFTIRKATVGYC